MGSSQRLAYLDAMGIRTWVSRTPASEVEERPVHNIAVDHASPLSDSVTVDRLARPARSASSKAAAPDLRVVRDSPGKEPAEWATLRQTVTQCRKCGLCESRSQTVFGVGDRKARWMIVGEAPGAEEDRQGEPFVGRAGQLLGSMLMAAGFKREEVFIANVLKCRPPENRDPHEDEMQACAPYLEQQIRMVAPRLILAVGRIAAQHLLQTTMPVGRLRGIRHIHAQTSTPVVVSYHPAYLLRRPSEKSKAWDDLRLAMSCSEPFQ
jgi:uracil-DNA glycosylase family 4